MATRYWVGGSGTWDGDSTTNWSTSSGGAGGASNPSSTDDVVFDGNSGSSPTISLRIGAECQNINTSSFNGTFVGQVDEIYSLAITGDATFSSTTVFSTYAIIRFAGTGTQNLNNNNASWLNSSGISLRNSVVSLQSNLIMESTGYIGGAWDQGLYATASAGLSLNSYTLSAPHVRITAGSLDFGSGKIVISGPGYTINTQSGGNGIFEVDYNNVTFSGSARTVEVTVPYSGNEKVVAGTAGSVDASITNSGLIIKVMPNLSSGGQILFGTYFNDINCNNQNFTFLYTGVFVCGDFTIGGPNVSFASQSGTDYLTFFSTSGQTALSKTITCNGGSFDRVTFADQTASTSTYTLVDNFSCTLFKFADNLPSAAGATSFNLNGKILNCGTFTTAGSDPRTITFGTNGRIRANVFNTSSTSNLTLVGTPLVEMKTPLTGVTNTFNSGLITTFNVSTVVESIGGTVSFTGGINNLTLANGLYNAAGSPTIYGDLVVSGSLPTVTSGTYTLAKSSGTQIINTNGATFNNTVNLNSASTTFRFDSAFTMGATGTLTLTTGTANFNGQAITIGILSSSNLNVRTLAFGDSTVTVLGSGTSWNCATSTNLTITYGGAGRISMNSASAKTFAGGSKTWPTVNQGGAGTLTVTGSNTFTNFTNTVTGCTIAFPSGTTIFTNFNVRGVPGSLVTMSSTSTLFKASGLVAVNYLNLSNSTATGGARWYAGAGSTDGGGNTGWLFTTASTGGFLAFF